MEAEIRKDDNKVRTSRGISKEVWEARPYTRWETNDRDPIREAYDGLSEAQRNFLMMLAGQRGGWNINRHAVPGAAHVWPEIRPDGLVRTGPASQHWHGTGRIPRSLERKYSVLDRDSEAFESHCRRVDEDKSEPAEYKPHALYEKPHAHESLAKYCFPPAAKELQPWDHDHSAEAYENPRRLEEHMRVWHKDTPEQLGGGLHRHYRAT